MAELNNTPWWVVPGAMVAAITLFMLIWRGLHAIYSAGQNSEVKRRGLVSQRQLEERMSACQMDQRDTNEQILQKVNALVDERREIWHLVRSTDKRTAVIEESVRWITKQFPQNGRVV